MDDLGGLATTAVGVLIVVAVVALAVLALRKARGDGRRAGRFALEAVTGELVINTSVAQPGRPRRGGSRTLFLDTTIQIRGAPPRQAFFGVDVGDDEASRLGDGACFPVKLLKDLTDVRLYLHAEEPERYLDLTRSGAGRSGG